MMKQRKTKHILSLILALCLLVPATCAVQPRYTTLKRLEATLSIDADGYASCYSKAEASNDSNRVDLSMELQRSSNGSSWSTIKTWSTSGNSVATLDKERVVSSGYQYRVHATASVYNSAGKLLETASTNSPVVK